jgi:hypothetical protein
MSTTTTTDELAGVSRSRALAGAAIAYIAAWLIGLGTAPSAPSPDAADATIQRFYADNGGAALAQATLVHGIAGIALAFFVVGLARHLAATATRQRTMVVLGAGLAAATVSLMQYAMEMALNRAAANADVFASATLFHAVNIADTVKLVLLAIAIATATRLAGEAQTFPRWVRGVGYALAPTLIIGGAAFVDTSDALSAVLAASLLLLLLWVATVAVVVTRRASVADATG